MPAAAKFLGSANFPGCATISASVIKLSPYSCLNLIKPAPSTVLGKRALLTIPTLALNEIIGIVGFTGLLTSPSPVTCSAVKLNVSPFPTSVL